MRGFDEGDILRGSNRGVTMRNSDKVGTMGDFGGGEL